MMATEKSLEYLNNELPTPLSMKRFRPNIVVSGVKEAHAEVSIVMIGSYI